MVIEYSGNVIRSVLTDKRERFYEGKVSEKGVIRHCKARVQCVQCKPRGHFGTDAKLLSLELLPYGLAIRSLPSLRDTLFSLLLSMLKQYDAMRLHRFTLQTHPHRFSRGGLGGAFTSMLRTFTSNLLLSASYSSPLQGIGCYMFRIDDHEVVDATVHGNAARFINHACEPNCHSRVVAVDGRKHIVILASRRVHPGEELTYDYKFPVEDAGSKLPCNCGAKRCRRFLN